MRQPENLQENLRKLPKYSLNETQKEKVLAILKKEKIIKKNRISMKPFIAIGVIFALLFILFVSSESGSIFNEVKLSFQPTVELDAQQATVFKNGQVEIIGVKDKVGILSGGDFVAEDDRRVAKLMLYFWGSPQLINQEYQVEAINTKGKKIILSEGVLLPPLENEHAHTLTSFPAIPTAGEWQLSFFVQDQLFEAFTIEVLPPFPKTENFLLQNSPSEISMGEDTKIAIESMSVDKKEIEVSVVNAQGKVVSTSHFNQSSNAIDSKTGKTIYDYDGSINFPSDGEWILKIDNEKTKPFIIK